MTKIPVSKELKTNEAAKYLNVCKKTLINWEKNGKLIPQRHPLTGFRSYSVTDLDDFLDTNKKTTTK